MNQQQAAAQAITGALTEIVDDKLLIARTIDHVSVGAAMAFIKKASADGIEFGDRALADISKMAAELFAKYVNALVAKFGLEFTARAANVLERDAPEQLAGLMYQPAVQARIKSMAAERRARADAEHLRTLVRDEGSHPRDIRSIVQSEQYDQAKQQERRIMQDLDNELRRIDEEHASKAGQRQYPKKSGKR